VNKPAFIWNIPNGFQTNVNTLQLSVITKSRCDKTAYWYVTTGNKGLHHIKIMW